MDIGSHKDSNGIYRHKYCFLGFNMSNLISLLPNLLHDSVIKEGVLELRHPRFVQHKGRV